MRKTCEQVMCKRERDTDRETFCTVDCSQISVPRMKVSTWAVSSVEHNTLTGCVCVRSFPDEAWQKSWYVSVARMQPGHVLLPRAPVGVHKITLFVEKIVMKLTTEKKGRGNERRRNSTEMSCVKPVHSEETQEWQVQWMRSTTNALSSLPSLDPPFEILS